MSSLVFHPYRVTKRLLDVGVAAVLLLGLAPLFALVAFCIWVEDGRPILFTQRRAGKDGKKFHILKFRSLSTGTKDPTRPGDYTTRVGAVLRRWGIDELPQLWNVLRGEMTLVGPRPALPRDVRKYGPEEQRRLAVRPGLTGWAQVHGRNALQWDERIEHDVWYVRNRCIALDLKILIRTPFVILRGVGVYGPNNRNPSYSKSISDD